MLRTRSILAGRPRRSQHAVQGIDPAGGEHRVDRTVAGRGAGPERRLDFAPTPFTIHTMRPAAPLGIGRYAVDAIADGEVVATSAFTVTA